MRGEYGEIRLRDIENLELPPRARRIRYISPARADWMGTTSACAENTSHPSTKGSNIWNYLRVRGEYGGRARGSDNSLELPPRARRIRPGPEQRCGTPGTTSACAENTPSCRSSQKRSWNYLRVRGEYSPQPGASGHSRELPPRARRIHKKQFGDHVVYGTTSACAENTRLPPKPRSRLRNYLRVRGEYVPSG